MDEFHSTSKLWIHWASRGLSTIQEWPFAAKWFLLQSNPVSSSSSNNWNTKFKTWGEATTLIGPYYLTPCCLPFHALFRLEQCIGMLLRTKGCKSAKRYKLHSGLALAYRSESNISFDSAPIVKMHTYCFYFRGIKKRFNATDFDQLSKDSSRSTWLNM